MMDINLTGICDKLKSGEKLSPQDLHLLEPLHDFIYDDNGRVIGASGNTSKDDHRPLTEDLNLPYLNRSFVDGGCNNEHETTSARFPRLVRYVGKHLAIRFAYC